MTRFFIKGRGCFRFLKRPPCLILLTTLVTTICTSLYWNTNGNESTHVFKPNVMKTETISVELKETHAGIIEERKSLHEVSTTEMSGSERAEYLTKACKRLKQQNITVYRKYSNSKRVDVRYNEKLNALYCPICKMASTFWKRIFAMFEKDTGAKTPFDIPLYEDFWKAFRKFYNPFSNIIQPDIKVNSDSLKFLIVRNPYPFLYSTFVDKLVAPNTVFWKLYGQPSIIRSRKIESRRCGSDVTFKEFITYTVDTILDKGASPECHTTKFTPCSPCSGKFNYVAQMETLAKDTFNILTHLNQTEINNSLKPRFKDLHAEDAILDTLTWFGNKTEITRCISWPEALRRMWRKLQLRGIIGAAPFPLTINQSLHITHTEFIELAKEAYKMSSPSERSVIKKEGFNEAFSTISPELSGKLNKAYEEDMLLFGYKPIDLTRTKEFAMYNSFRNFFDYEKDLEKIKISS